MNNKLIVIFIFFTVIFAAFITVANAKNFNLLGSNKQNIIVTLKNEADIDKSKGEISKIPQIKIIKITYRDKEWSKMVNKYDLPKMENPFKNEFTVKVNKNANTDEILKKIKEMSFVEKVEFLSDKEKKQK